MDTLTDRADLIELFGRYADIADLKEFAELPGLVFTDPVTLDFSSVADIPPMTTPLSEYVEILRASFALMAGVVAIGFDSAVNRRGVQAAAEAEIPPAVREAVALPVE